MKDLSNKTYFGQRLKYVLDLRGISQRKLAENIGVTEAAMSRYIKNERKPNYGVIIDICRELNISADWLLGLM